MILLLLLLLLLMMMMMMIMIPVTIMIMTAMAMTMMMAPAPTRVQVLTQLPRKLADLNEQVEAIESKAQARITRPCALLQAASTTPPHVLLASPSMEPLPLSFPLHDVDP